MRRQNCKPPVGGAVEFALGKVLHHLQGGERDDHAGPTSVSASTAPTRPARRSTATDGVGAQRKRLLLLPRLAQESAEPLAIARETTAGTPKKMPAAVGERVRGEPRAHQCSQVPSAPRMHGPCSSLYMPTKTMALQFPMTGYPQRLKPINSARTPPKDRVTNNTSSDGDSAPAHS